MRLLFPVSLFLIHLFLLNQLLVLFFFHIIAVHEVAGSDLTEGGSAHGVIVLGNGVVVDSGALLLIHGVGQRGQLPCLETGRFYRKINLINEDCFYPNNSLTASTTRRTGMSWI